MDFVLKNLLQCDFALPGLALLLCKWPSFANLITQHFRDRIFSPSWCIPTNATGKWQKESQIPHVIIQGDSEFCVCHWHDLATLALVKTVAN